MNRNRLVIDNMGRQDVSGLIIADEDIRETLELEIRLHEETGWEVQDFGQMLRCTKGKLVRWVWVRTRPALEDET